MKKIHLLIILLFVSAFSFAQTLNPVSWSFTSKKLADNTYQIEMVATIQQGWHLYAQEQPKDAIAIPTSFAFNKNPLVSLEGKVKEIGRMEKFKDEKLGVAANQYSNKVVFVQKVKLRGKAKTNVTGKLEFQTCNDQRCLPPKTINLSIPVS
jgi:hypothetical protein